jgi:hypothetical protein
MPGSKDGEKLYYAACGGKGEEVEKLLKMGVKPNDYKDGVRRLCPPPLSVLRLQSPPPIATPLNPQRGIEPLSLISSLIPHTSPRAMNLTGLRTGRHCSKVGGGLTVVGNLQHLPASDALEISDCLLTFIFRAESSSRCLEFAFRLHRAEAPRCTRP